MFNYLSTLRLQDSNGTGGHTLTVGPKRRVVFKNAIFGCNKGAVKRALRPLAGYWSKPSEDGHAPGAPVQKGMKVMSMQEFRLKARQLLKDADLLIPRERDEQEAATEKNVR